MIQCIESIKDYPILIEQTVREDSNASNHVAGQLSQFLKLTFKNRMNLQTFLQFFKNEKGIRQYANPLPQILKENQRIFNPADLIKYINKLAETDV